jgi:uncharacterized protein (TIGR02449 family)
MEQASPIDQIAERVERLLLRYEELQRTNALLAQQVATLTQERDSFKSRLSAARSRVDALLERLVSAKTKGHMLNACRALERVIAHSHIFVPQWTAGTHRMVYSAQRLALPPSMPPYAANELWAVRTWWAK